MAEPYKIYIDDSGNSDDATTNAPEVRYGSVTAVIIADDYLQSTFNSSFEMLSKRHFGCQPDGRPYNIHRRALAKPAKDGPFAGLLEEGKREAWNTAALAMLTKAQYTAITACVDKAEWYFRYPAWSGDFYEVLIGATLERCWYFLKDRDGSAEVNIETKNPQKNERIKSAYRRALTNGFDHITAPKLRAHFSSVEPNILKKEDCRPGAQLADLLAAPALQHIRHLHTGRHAIESTFVRAVADLLEHTKFYRGDHGPSGYGRIWRPAPPKN